MEQRTEGGGLGQEQGAPSLPKSEDSTKGVQIVLGKQGTER